MMAQLTCMMKGHPMRNALQENGVGFRKLGQVRQNLLPEALSAFPARKKPALLQSP